MKNENEVISLAAKNYKRKRSNGVEIIPQKSTAVTDVMEMALRNRERLGLARYTDTDADFERFRNDSFEYLNFIRAKNAENVDEGKTALIPSIEGWALSLGTSRKTIMLYERRGGRWSDFIDAFKTALYDAKGQLASSGKIPPVVHIFDFVNNAGYLNTSEIHISEPIETEKPRLTAAEIRAKLGLLPDIDSESED